MKYAVAIKRGVPYDLQDDWAIELPLIPGVSVLGGIWGMKEGRAVIQADDQAILLIRARFGDSFHIEPIISHDPC